MPGLDLNVLPRFSPWPARLLGIEPWRKHFKTPSEVTREYEGEKWGPLLQAMGELGRRPSIEEADRWFFRDSPSCLCCIGEEVRELARSEAHALYLRTVADSLTPYLPASALVEMGAGYGSVILGLARQEPFRRMRLVAGEYTPSGVKLLRLLAAAQSLDLSAGNCDFRSSQLTEVEVPAGAIIFTSFATHYVPKLLPDFLEALCARKPAAVVHFEPCYEHCDLQTLMGLLRRRYIEVNDYNTNLVTLLHEYRGRGRIEILKEQPAVFGIHPFLAASAITWRPTS